MQYRTPLVRLMVYLFSYCGLQLRTVDSLGGVINLLWNMFIAGTIIYSLIVLHFERPFIARSCSGDNSSRTSNNSSTSSNGISPLFSLFIHSTFSIIRPACFSISIAYYLLAGRRLLVLLDSPLFSTVYHSVRQARLIMASMIFLAHFIFVAFWFVNRNAVLIVPLALEAARVKWSEVALFFFSQYMVNMYQYSVCLVLHYYQHATAVILKRIERKLRAAPLEEVTREQCKVEDHCLRQMIVLGRVNSRLSRLISMPLLTYIVMNAAQVTMSICFTLLCTPNFSMLANSLSVWIYLLYLAILNERIKSRVKNVFSLMRKPYQPIEEMMQKGRWRQQQVWPFKKTASRRPWWYTGGSEDFPENYDNKSDDSRRQRRAMRMQQADLYQSYFTIKMFHFTWLGLPFIFQMVLFVANYVVLMTQTQ